MLKQFLSLMCLDLYKEVSSITCNKQLSFANRLKIKRMSGYTSFGDNIQRYLSEGMTDAKLR